MGMTFRLIIIKNEAGEYTLEDYDLAGKNRVNILGRSVEPRRDYLNKTTRPSSNELYYLEFLYLLKQYMDKNNITEIDVSNLPASLFSGVCTMTVSRYKKKFQEIGLLSYRRKVRTSVKDHGKNGQFNIITAYSNIDAEGLKKYALEHYRVNLDDEVKLDDFFKLIEAQNRFFEEMYRICGDEGDKESKRRFKKAKQQRLQKEKEAKKLSKIFKSILNIAKNLKHQAIFSFLEQGRLRETNPLCNTRNEEHEGSTRIKEIQRLFNTSKPIDHIDVKSSMYQIAYILGNHSTLGPFEDIYEMVFKMCKFVCDTPFEQIRPFYKLLFMPLYMAEWSINYKSSIYNRLKRFTTIFDKKDRAFCELFDELETLIGCPIEDIMKRTVSAMHKLFNQKKFLRGRIFVHESNLYILMREEFEKRGIDTVNVYDSFYFIEGTVSNELFEMIYRLCVKRLLEIYDTINVKLMNEAENKRLKKIAQLMKKPLNKWTAYDTKTCCRLTINWDARAVCVY